MATGRTLGYARSWCLGRDSPRALRSRSSGPGRRQPTRSACTTRVAPRRITNFSTIQGAVDAAANNNSSSATKDRILVGPGTYSSISSGNSSVIADQTGNPVEIAGSGPSTVVAWPAPDGNNDTVVSLGDPTSEIHDAGVRMPVGSQNFGVSNAGTLKRVAVFAPALESMGAGVYGGTLRDGSISVPGTASGIVNPLLVQRADLTANVPVDVGVTFNVVNVEDAVLRSVGASGFGARVESSLESGTLNLRHVDVIGDGSPNSVGVRVGAGNGFVGSTSASADVRSSIVRGFAQNFSRSGSTGCSPPGGQCGPPCDPGMPGCIPGTPTTNVASITVAYSDLQPATTPDTDSGPGTLNESSPGGNTIADPGFVSPTTLRLRHDSTLIDRGDPASPAAGDSQTDRAGLPRKVDGNGDGIARADIGAFEYQRLAPRVFASARPPAVKRNNPVTFTAAIVDDPGDTIVSYKWKFDDGGTATGRAVKHRFKHPGIHRGTLAVADVTGRKGSGAARVFVGPVEILSASLSPEKFRAGHRTTIEYDLSASAPITLAISRCNSSGLECKHKVGQLQSPGHAGANKLHFDGKIAGVPLPAGRYRAVVISGAGSIKTRSGALSFQILSGGV